MTVDTLALVAVLALASYRVTRLVVHDEVLGQFPDDGRPRGTGLRALFDRLVWTDDGDDRGPARGWVGRLMTCSFCVGVWVSLGLVCAWLGLWPHELGVEGWVVVAAVAGGQGFVSSRHGA